MLAPLILTGCTQDEAVGAANGDIVAGAGYTTFDATLLGCLDSPNGVNCNNYETKEAVFMSGGPSTGAGLSNGDYYFSVLVPGFQNGGFVQGADGNLSDETAGTTLGDDGSGDSIANRTFSVSNHRITAYAGTHAMGITPNGKDIIQLMPYDDTSNNGGVYILAICQVGATSPSQCKYDAFRLREEGEPPPPPFGTVDGMKYYDANANGQLDSDEVGIPNWLVNYHDGISEQLYTDANGQFTRSLIADTYTFTEAQGGSTWMQTGNVVDQTTVSGGSFAVLESDKTYTVSVVDGSVTGGIFFGNLCIGPAPNNGGKTLGFWSNKNGSAIMKGSDNYASSLAMLGSLNLHNGTGQNFDPATYAQFRSWILSATAVNMAYMLSAQLAAMELNVWSGQVSGSALIFAPGATSSNVNGFATVADVMAEANASLGSYPLTESGSGMRTYQEALKNALDRGNNNLNFVQANWQSCPAPDLRF